MMGEHECTSRLRGYNFFFTTATLLPEGRKIALINLGLDDSARRATRRCRVSSLCGLEPRIRPWRTTLYNKEDNAGGRHVVHNAEVVEFYQRAFFAWGYRVSNVQLYNYALSIACFIRAGCPAEKNQGGVAACVPHMLQKKTAWYNNMYATSFFLKKCEVALRKDTPRGGMPALKTTSPVPVSSAGNGGMGLKNKNTRSFGQRECRERIWCNV